MKKHFKKFIKIAFVFVLGFVLTLSSALADTRLYGPASGDSDQIIVNIYLAKELLDSTAKADGDTIITDAATNGRYKRLENRSLLIWRIDKHIEGTKEEIDRQKISLTNKLEKMKNNELIEKYGQPYKSNNSDKNGHIKQALKKGSTYYVREYISDERTKSIVSNFVIVTDRNSISELDIYSKSVYKPRITGNRFVKVDFENTNKRLRGAVFRVEEKSGDSYKAVIKNGVQYVVSSDENGEFIVDGLPQGTYYLFEVKAPTGYLQLSSPIEFKVGSGHSQDDVLMIKNKIDMAYGGGKHHDSRNAGNSRGNSDGKISIPKTGDIMLLLLTIGGVLVAALGHLLLKDKKEGY
ncbi:MSCRAMM family protein [Peptostreptococcus sp. D1]|uniref:MSCRAMM family protein n=1 Tax=Peptostreptococcus sp. D1 TaxID=72304 RepID=UPI0008E7392D|nr:SpaA isopeptide-forming pilin-related protein [Peptostreptococcus sp. D1]SFE25870.1 Cna protein B-type domain-containing protein [Peptostreptococcus sp. D1]